MIDSHVHVGWFVDRYHSPDKITEDMRSVGFDTILVSSTSTCAEEYDLVIDELSWLKDEWGNNLISALWITPKMLQNGALDKMLSSDIEWKVIKTHWQAHPQFYHSSNLINMILSDSRLMGMPILFHTGLFPECQASVFSKIIAENPDRNFILAHGRPIDETIRILCISKNVFVDTAFMPVSDIVSLVNNKLEDRILWGSDCPINLHFNSETDTVGYLTHKLGDLKAVVSPTIYEKITEKNFHRIF